MPQIASPYGFSLVYYKGSNFSGTIAPYYLPTAYGTSLAQGDPLTPNTVTVGTLAQGIVGAATAQAQVVGVFNSVTYSTATQQSQLNQVPQPFWTANTPTLNGQQPLLDINDLPYCIFQVQTNATTGASLVFKNYNYGIGVPNAATNQSTYVLDLGTNGPEAFRNCKVIGLANPAAGQTNAWTDPFVDVLVIFNNHMYKPGTLGM